MQRLSFGDLITIHDALCEWKRNIEANGASPGTVKTYLRNLERMFKNTSANVSTITSEQIDRFVNAKDQKSLSTKNGRLAAAKSFMHFCSSSGFVIGNPADLVQVKLHDLELEQLEPDKRKPLPLALLGDISDLPIFWQTAILFAAHQGFRLSDVAQLAWASFEQPGKVLWYPDKTRRRMIADLHPACAEIIKKVRPTHRVLFPKECEIAQDPNRRAGLSVQFSRILEARGLQGYCFHGLRHDFATRLARETQDLDKVRDRLGHTSTKTTEIYVH